LAVAAVNGVALRVQYQPVDAEEVIVLDMPHGRLAG
jgi:hypothetical protein